MTVTIPALLAPIRATLDAATPGPWRTEPVEDGRFAGVESRVYSLWGSHILLSPTDGEAGQAKTADAVFIASAPVTVTRLLAAVEAVVELHRHIKIYDECECPEGTHPEEYDYIDCDSYVGCENSLTAVGCKECCSCGDFLTEECGEHHTHTLDPNDRCPTVRALTAALGDKR